MKSLSMLFQERKLDLGEGAQLPPLSFIVNQIKYLYQWCTYRLRWAACVVMNVLQVLLLVEASGILNMG